MIDGLSGKLFQTITLPVKTSPASLLTNFSLSTNVTSSSVSVGKTVPVGIHVASLNGCVCIVQVSMNANASYSGPDRSLVTVSPSSSADSIVVLFVPAYSGSGVIVATIIGSSGAIVHSLQITLEYR